MKGKAYLASDQLGPGPQRGAWSGEEAPTSRRENANPERQKPARPGGIPSKDTWGGASHRRTDQNPAEMVAEVHARDAIESQRHPAGISLRRDRYVTFRAARDSENLSCAGPRTKDT